MHDVWQINRETRDKPPPEAPAILTKTHYAANWVNIHTPGFYTNILPRSFNSVSKFCVRSDSGLRPKPGKFWFPATKNCQSVFAIRDSNFDPARNRRIL